MAENIDTFIATNRISSFSHDLSVGNRLIDFEHNNLYEIISQIAGLVKARKIAALPGAFELLENRLCAYFAVEENIAKALCFDFNPHKLAHENLLNRCKLLEYKLMSRSVMWHESEWQYYICSLADCLTRHIKEDGKPFKEVLSTCLYDFKSESKLSG